MHSKNVFHLVIETGG